MPKSEKVWSLANMGAEGERDRQMRGSSNCVGGMSELQANSCRDGGGQMT